MHLLRIRHLLSGPAPQPHYKFNVAFYGTGWELETWAEGHKEYKKASKVSLVDWKKAEEKREYERDAEAEWQHRHGNSSYRGRS